MSTDRDKAPAGDRPFYPAAALGFRAWGVRERSLVSVTFSSFEWRPGATRASCEHGHPAPHPRCSCGLYAYHELGPAIHVPWGGLGMVGAIASCGNLEVHARGFRGAEAQILALLEPKAFLGRLTDVSRRRAQLIARRYRVPLFDDHKELIAYCREHAAVVPADLRPPLEEPGREERF